MRKLKIELSDANKEILDWVSSNGDATLDGIAYNLNVSMTYARYHVKQLVDAGLLFKRPYRLLHNRMIYFA